MLTETFDINTEPMISPEAFYGVRKKVCDICIITFSDVVVEAIRTKFACTRIAEIGSVNGGRPIWLMTYKGRNGLLLGGRYLPGGGQMPYRGGQLYYVRFLWSA